LRSVLAAIHHQAAHRAVSPVPEGMAGRRYPMISMALASFMGHASEIWPWSFLESDAEGGVECASCSSVGQSIGRGRESPVNQYTV
jgi:hypothetical protein